MRVSLAVPLVAMMCAGAVPLMAGDAIGQEGATGRTLFPKNWVSGYVDFAFAPPHNEPDLNRCSAAVSHLSGANTSCAAFARYIGSSYIEFRPIGKGFLHRFFVFVQPEAYMGRNIPQYLYTSSATPIALDRTQGVAFDVSRNFELRLTSHRVDWFGQYNRYLGMGDLGKNGPLSSYTTISARWYFGGYRRRDSGY